MYLEFTKEFKHAYRKLPSDIQKLVNKQLSLLLDNPFHPSQNSKKLKGKNNIWQARISSGYRFTFMLQGDVYYLLHIFRHE